MSKPASRLGRILVVAAAAVGLIAVDGSIAAPSSVASDAYESGVPIDASAAAKNLPPVGRSLFDFFLLRSRDERQTYDVPFPFSTLIKKLEAGLQADTRGAASIKSALIPLGRSLQRTAAAPEFFKYPRVIIATDSGPRSNASDAGLLLKDRLYLGFQEKSNVIEVISYNEAAGRFEFQLVKNYRTGANPQVFYAERALCTSCHQNEGPIFSRQLWDETNANPAIAALLRNERRDFYGIKVDNGVDIPYAIDNATDRANVYSAYQALWRDGCGSEDNRNETVSCRAGLFTAVLQYLLSGGQAFDESAASYRGAVIGAFAKAGRKHWPNGVSIPNPDLPNRDPLSGRSGSGIPVLPANLINIANVSAAFDPLNLRAPLEVWPMSDPVAVSRRLVAGLSEFIADSDMRRLDDHLFRAAMRAKAPTINYTGVCEITRKVTPSRGQRIDFSCSRSAVNQGRGAAAAGRIYVEGRKILGGSLDRLTMVDAGASGELRDLDIASGTSMFHSGSWSAKLGIERARGHVRRADGNAIASITLTWPESSQPPALKSPSSGLPAGEINVTVVQDFSPVQSAVDAVARDTIGAKLDAFSNQPFRRAAVLPALFAKLGMQPLDWCCLKDAGLPPPAIESTAAMAVSATVTDAAFASVQPFYQYCATCHRSADRFPPNFLAGNPREVSAKLAHCAQRLYVRLSMWQLALEERPKTPMPPLPALPGLQLSAEAWRNSGELAALRNYVANILKTQNSTPPAPEQLLSGGYERLPACLADSG